MAYSDNLMAMDSSWMFRNNAFPETWLPEQFSRETETLTKALQKSFENQLFDNINFSSDEFISYPWYLENSNNYNCSDTTATTTTTTATATVSGENNSNSGVGVDVVTSRKRRISNDNSGSGNGVVGGGKIVKRKSRASKRATTTFINADVADFRRLVQEVTGVKFGGGGGGGGGGVVKPEVNRLRMVGGGGGGVVSTLDTSAFLLEGGHRNNKKVGGGGATETVVVEGGSASSSHSQFHFDSFCSFPTLESWKGI